MTIEAAWGGPGMGNFQGKYQGQIQDFSIRNGRIVDAAGTPVDPNQILYPSWDPMIGLTAERVPAGRHAAVIPEELGDLPQPALPIAYGDEEENEPTDAETIGDRAYAARVYARINEGRRTALKNFSPAEKDALINEGDGGTRAAHLLNLDGTHYEQMMIPEQETDWLW